MINDLSTMRVIGIGRESGSLYILETEVSKSISSSEVINPFELHCHLHYPSLSIEEVISSVF